MFIDGKHKGQGMSPHKKQLVGSNSKQGKRLADLDCSSQSRGQGQMTAAACLKAGWDHYW